MKLRGQMRAVVVPVLLWLILMATAQAAGAARLSPHFRDPDSLSSKDGHVWVANYDNSAVTELSASTGAVIKVIAGSRYHLDHPGWLVSDGTHVWIPNYHADSLTELSASTGALVRVLRGPGYRFNGPLAVSVDGDHVWVINENGNSVTEPTTA